MYSGAASQGGGWWQGCGVAYGKAEGSATTIAKMNSN
jgi:hypothetical protein